MNEGTERSISAEARAEGEVRNAGQKRGDNGATEGRKRDENWRGKGEEKTLWTVEGRARREKMGRSREK